MGSTSPDIDLLLACLLFGAAELEVDSLKTASASDSRSGPSSTPWTGLPTPWPA